MKIIRERIAVRSILSVILLLASFTAIVSVIGYRSFTDALLTQYADSAFRIADAGANAIDDSKLEGYLESGGTAEGYREAWDRLDRLCNGADFTFIYVIQPDLTDYAHITFLFSTVNHNSVYSPYEVGYVRDTTNDEYRMKYRRLYEGESERELVLLTDRQFSLDQHHLTAMVPLHDEGETRAILCVQRPMGELVAVRQAYVRKVILVMFLLGSAAIVAGTASLTQSLLRPLQKITEEASRFARENVATGEKLTDSIRSKDEIGRLAASIDTMEEQIQRYVVNLTRATAERERISTELSVGTRIQASMLLHDFPPFPNRKEFSVYAVMDPAKEVGGDFYDIFLIDDDHLCLVIADVAGKGVPAALFMTAVKVILANNAMMGKRPAQILADTNTSVCAQNREEMFVTVWLGILEISTGRLTAVNAGHEYPALREPDGYFTLYKDRHGLPVGAMEGVRYREYELLLKPGSKLFVYTDGVPEATDADNQLFGTAQMLEALNIAPGSTPEDILKNVRAAVDGFVKDAEQFDDLTMLCFSYHGPQSGDGNTPGKA